MHTDLFGSPAEEHRATPAAEAVTVRRAPRRWPLLGTLKARLLLGGLLALWASIGVTAWQMSQVAERELLAQADQREQADVLAASRVLGQRVQDLLHALKLAAATIEPATLADPQRLAAHFEHRPLLRSTFSSLFLARSDGELLLVMDGAGVRTVASNLADRAYFQRTLAERRPVIADAASGRIANEPVVVFTHPLVQGEQVVAVLGGALHLASHDLLQLLGEDDAAAATVSVRGGLAPLTVVTDASGRLLTHPQRALLLQPLDAEPRLASALAQASARTRSSSGQVWRQGAERVATASEALSGWRVWRAVSHQAVLSPLRAAWRASLLPAALTAGVLTAVLGAFLVWQLRPLAQLQQRAEGLLRGDLALAEGWPAAGGEIGQLSRTLRHVWAEREQVEAFNTQVMQRLGSVMAASPVGLAFTRHGRFELVSAEMGALLQRPEASLMGQPTQLIFASNEDHAELGPQVGAAFARGEPYLGEWRLLRADGSSFWGRLRARPMSPGDATAGTIWSVDDISDQVQQREQLQHAARHDPLTGTLNRHGFERELQPLYTRFAACAPGGPAVLAALVMIDLDHFKPINDSAGHAAGDAMLVAVARCILAQVRGTDVLARLGGDEFALLLPGCDQARGLALAEKVRKALSELVLPWEGRSLRIGASLGVASLGAGHASAADWLREADAACYEAKRCGRNAVGGQGAPARPTPAGLRVVA